MSNNKDGDSQTRLASEDCKALAQVWRAMAERAVSGMLVLARVWFLEAVIK